MPDRLAQSSTKSQRSQIQALPKKEKISCGRAKPTKRHLRAERFHDFPVLETIELMPEAVKADLQMYNRSVAESTFEVRITTTKLWKRAIVRPNLRHQPDRSQPPTIAPALQGSIDNSYESPELLAYVALRKYLYRIPLYRQEKMFAH